MVRSGAGTPGTSRQLEKDVNSAFLLRFLSSRIKFSTALLEKFHRLADGGIAKVNSRDDDPVELGHGRLSPADACSGLDFRSCRPPFLESLDGAFPGFIDHPQHPAASLIIRVSVVFRFLEIHLLHAFPGGDIVSVDVKNVFVTPGCQIEAARLEEAISFVKQLGDLFAIRSELWRHGFVVVVRLFKVGEQLNRSLVRRVVLWK